MPSRGSQRTRLSFSSAIASMLPSFETCVSPMFSTTPTSGRRDLAEFDDLALAVHRQLQHGDLVVAAQAHERQRQSLAASSGCPGCGASGTRCESTAAVNSLAVVLPTVPVMPTTARRTLSSARHAPVRRRAFVVSGATTIVAPGQSAVGRACADRGHGAGCAAPPRRSRCRRRSRRGRPRTGRRAATLRESAAPPVMAVSGPSWTL